MYKNLASTLRTYGVTARETFIFGRSHPRSGVPV